MLEAVAIIGAESKVMNAAEALISGWNQPLIVDNDLRTVAAVIEFKQGILTVFGDLFEAKQIGHDTDQFVVVVGGDVLWAKAADRKLRVNG